MEGRENRIEDKKLDYDRIKKPLDDLDLGGNKL